MNSSRELSKHSAVAVKICAFMALACGNYSWGVGADHAYTANVTWLLPVTICSACADAFAVAHQADLGATVAATPAMDAKTLYIRTENALLAFR